MSGLELASGYLLAQEVLVVEVHVLQRPPKSHLQATIAVMGQRAQVCEEERAQQGSAGHSLAAEILVAV